MGHHVLNHKEALIGSLILSVIILGKGKHKKVLPEVEKVNNKKSCNNEKKEGNNNEYVVNVNDLFVVCDSCVENINISCDKMDWVVINGASTHATLRRDVFSTHETSDFGVVCMGNNGQANVIEIGDICVKTRNGITLILKGVKHIP